jgi:hypothetical protein
MRGALLGASRKEDRMRVNLVVAVVAFAAVSAPALAAEFYIVQDTSTHRCRIVEERPTATTTTIVGGKAYTTRTEAEGAMKTVKVCESGGTVGGPVPAPAPVPR